MTELSPVGTMTAANDEVLGSCGILPPNTQAKIVDVVTGEELPQGQRGELCIKGPQVFLRLLTLFHMGSTPPRNRFFK